MTTPRKRAPGGGRPRIAPGGTVRKTITLTLPDAEYLAGLHKSTTLAVRLLVEQHRALGWLLRMANDLRWIDPPLPVGVELDPAYVEIAKRRVEEVIAKGANNGKHGTDAG